MNRKKILLIKPGLALWTLFLLLLAALVFAPGSPALENEDSPAKETPSTQADKLPDGGINLNSYPGYYRPGNKRLFSKVLPNGLKVVVQERPGCGLVSAEFLVRVGVMQEMDTYGGIIGVIQSTMTKSGGKDRKIALGELAEADGCILGEGATPDFAFLSIISTKDSFRVNFKRMVEVFKHPDFSPEITDDIKKKKVQQLTEDRSGFQIINEIFLKEFYRYHPYRQPIYGFKNTIERLTQENLQKFYDDYYTANRITLAVCGDINGMETLDLCEKILSDVPRRKIKTVDIPWEPEGQEKKLYLQTNADTAWLFVGFPAPDIKSPDYPAMKILETLLGGGLSSRLFIELREKEGLAYELSSNYPRLVGPAHMILYVVTNSQGMNKSRKKLFKEINRIKKDPVDLDEMEAAKRRIMGEYLISKETTAGQAHNLAFFTAFGAGPDYDETLLHRIQRVTIDDIRNVARKYLQNFTILDISPPDRAYPFFQ